MFSKEVIEYNGKVYWIFRKFISTTFKDIHLPDLTKAWNCDEYVKHTPPNGDPHEYLFLRLINEAEIIE